MLVSVVGGLLVLALVLVNVAVLADGPSRRQQMRTPGPTGVSPGQYHDAWHASLEAESALIRFHSASESYLYALAIDDGAEVINGADYLAQLDLAVADLAASPARQDPGFEELHATWSESVQGYRASRQTFLEASEVVAPVLEACNPHALPAHTPRDPANEELLRGCSEDLSSLDPTGDPFLDDLVAQAQPLLDQWAGALGGSSAADTARDDYIMVFVDGAARASEENRALEAPVLSARTALADYAEARSEPGR